MTIDLHTHTTCSDGSMTPTELVQLAAKKGLSAIGITDHDTVEGIEEALAAGIAAGIEVVPGIELSTHFQEHTLHILGYYIQQDDAELQTRLDELQKGRQKRNDEIIKKLDNLNIHLELSELLNLSTNDLVGRPHFARLLVQKGVVRSMEEAFSKYLGKGAAAYVRRFAFTAEEMIAIIKRSGGVAILAHPRQLKIGNESLTSMLNVLKEKGLDGVEVYYPTHSRQYRKLLISYADRRDLIVTGGSDYHGAIRPNTTLAGGRKVSVPARVLTEIKQRVMVNRKKFTVKN